MERQNESGQNRKGTHDETKRVRLKRSN